MLLCSITLQSEAEPFGEEGKKKSLSTTLFCFKATYLDDLSLSGGFLCPNLKHCIWMQWS